MTYQKPQVEIVKFDTVGFMTSSVGYTDVAGMMQYYNVTGWNGNNRFSCSGFGGCGNAVAAPGDGQFTTIHNTLYKRLYSTFW